jgi:hypothetical protein
MWVIYADCPASDGDAVRMYLHRTVHDSIVLGRRSGATALDKAEVHRMLARLEKVQAGLFAGLDFHAEGEQTPLAN